MVTRDTAPRMSTDVTMHDKGSVCSHMPGHTLMHATATVHTAHAFAAWPRIVRSEHAWAPDPTLPNSIAPYPSRSSTLSGAASCTRRFF